MKLDTSADEKKVLELIRIKYDGIVSRYILEGILLYELDYSPKRMYQVLMNLTLREELELVEEGTGEYYKVI